MHALLGYVALSMFTLKTNGSKECQIRGFVTLAEAFRVLNITLFHKEPCFENAI